MGGGNKVKLPGVLWDTNGVPQQFCGFQGWVVDHDEINVGFKGSLGGWIDILLAIGIVCGFDSAARLPLSLYLWVRVCRVVIEFVSMGSIL